MVLVRGDVNRSTKRFADFPHLSTIPLPLRSFFTLKNGDGYDDLDELSGHDWDNDPDLELMFARKPGIEVGSIPPGGLILDPRFLTLA